MDPRDDELEFDFFDEPATRESQAPSARTRLPRRGGRGTGMRRPAGPPRGLTPMLRLLVAIVALVALFVVFGLLIQSCASTSKHDSYANYMDNVAKIARGSQEDGVAVANALTSASKAASISATLRGIADQERQNVKQAQSLDPPGPLRPENEQLIEALQLRISGVNGLAQTIDALAPKKTTGEVALLEAQSDRLLASDVVWADLFQGPARTVMAHEGVKGAPPPDSTFVSNRQLFAETSLNLMLSRLRGASTGGQVSGLHGTNIVGTIARPGGNVKPLTLSTSSENTITATPSLAFAVTVEDSGDAQEVNIQVTMTLKKDGGGKPIVQTKKIAVINPGQKKIISFSGINTSGFFAVKSHLDIDVKPVKGETRVDNNHASYPVIFSLG
ncbi:MAG TPA: hypothetical protein VLJ44_01015 [Gaiellaceae bacterium]|nr:hypothetical protein [Gaiellaceae bacterium]